VISILTDNSETTYDGKTLLHATSHGGNLTTDALSEANLTKGVQVMRKQTDRDGNPIDIRPEFLLVPPDLSGVALRITKSQTIIVAGSTDVDKGNANVVPLIAGQLKLLDPLGVSYIKTATDWFLLANPNDAPVIEIGFLNGVQTPLVFREATQTGTQFERDVTRWKVRYVFGECAVDHVGVYGRT
jgi:hypothetical protein